MQGMITGGGEQKTDLSAGLESVRNGTENLAAVASFSEVHH